MAEINKKLRIPILVLLIVGFAFLLRTYHLRDNLFFGWEQGRDFIKYQEILSGDPALVGPKTDIDGVFHGALSYYIPIVPYIVFNGSPYLVLVLYVAVNSLAIVLLYKSAQELFSERVANLATLFYAVSYSSVIYARWLSNPTLVPALSIAYFYFLIKAKENWKYLVLALVSWAIIFHLILVVAVSFVLPTLLLIYKDKIRFNLGRLMALGSVGVVMSSSYFAFEFKNNFVMTKSFLADSRSHGNFLTSDLGLFDQFLNEVVDSVFPYSPRIALIIFVIVIFVIVRSSKSIKNSYLPLSFLFAMPLLFLFVSDAPLRHFFISVPVFLSIVVALVVDHMIVEKRKPVAYLLLTIVVVGNVCTAFKRLPESEGNFIHHAQRTYLSDMTDLLDWIYADADGNEFTYDYYSVPYWKEDAWTYLFNWYGKGQYGYAPAVDRTNVDRSDIFYTLIEPNESVPVHLDNWYGEYKKDLELIDTYQSGQLRVEKRREKK